MLDSFRHPSNFVKAQDKCDVPVDNSNFKIAIFSFALCILLDL